MGVNISKALKFGTIVKGQNDPLKLFETEEVKPITLAPINSNIQQVQTSASTEKSTDPAAALETAVSDIRKKRGTGTSISSTLGINT